MWIDFLMVKNIYLSWRKMAIDDGKQTDFWRDTWWGDLPLCDQFPQLYEICNTQICTVETVAKKIGI